MSRRRRTVTAPRTSPRQKVRDVYVARPFEGLASEVEWVALRELVPAATAPLRLTDQYAERADGRTLLLATVLPMAWPAMTRSDGRVFVGLQRQFQSGDVSRDMAAALLQALDTEPGQTVAVPALPGPGPRLQDMLTAEPLEITLHEGFEFWMEEGSEEDSAVQASLERANATIYPTQRLSPAGAYWCRVSGRGHVRWVLPDEEDRALRGLSRLAAAGTMPLGPETKFAGMFRAHGLLAPVWDLPGESEADTWEEPMVRFAERYAQAVAVDEPLTAEERRARQGLVGRQLTLR